MIDAQALARQLLDAEPAAGQPPATTAAVAGPADTADTADTAGAADTADTADTAGAAGAADQVGHTVALAWALKDLCYAAWSSSPPRAARAAALLGGLPLAGLAAAQVLQVRGLAAWTAGIAHVTHGHMAEAVVAFDQAATHLQAAGQPDAAAQTQVPKIMALSMLGQHAQATACAEAAQPILLALGNVAAASRVSLNLAGLLLRRDAYADAARHYRQAAVLFARLGDHLHSVLADIGLAAALSAQGNFDEALRIYARARMRATNHHLLQPLALVDESVALVDLARGHYSAALAGLESARRGFEALGLPHALAIAEKQLADAYLDLRLLPEALALFDAAVAKFDELQLPDEQAWALLQRGRTQALLQRGAAAAASLAQAQLLFAGQAHAVGLSSVVLAQARLALARGDAAGALAQARQAEAGFRQAGQADGLARAQVLGALALYAAGQHAAAQAAFTHTLASARQLQQLQVQVRCLTGLGQVAQGQGHTAQARAAFDEAIELLEDQRSALPGDELRSAFLHDDHLRPYQERLRQALAGGDAGDVLLQLERYRARSLADRFAEVPAAPLADDEPALRQHLNWLYRRLQRQQEDDVALPAQPAADTPSHPAAQAATEPASGLQSNVLRTERALLERARRQRLAQPTPGMPSAGAPGFSLAALQAALGPADALVEYGVLDDELFALVITAGGVHLQRALAGWAQTQQALQSTRFQIDTLRHGYAPVQAHLPAIHQRTQARLAQLHGLIWAPLQPWLAGTRRVLVVPHGPLGAVPFAALGPTAAPLGQQVQLALLPSARAALRGLQRQPVAARSALALGESSQLPHAGAEAQAVAALFSPGLALVGPAATLAALQQHAATADVIHLACHAQFRSDNPRFSALHLHDAPLTVELAERLHLRAGVVVLSACESGVSDRAAGDEMVGLVRAFLVAGAARVLATLWPVDDAVTARFMQHFYTALAAGQPAAMALQLAQAALRQDHPEAFYWAGFTLYGGW